MTRYRLELTATADSLEEAWSLFKDNFPEEVTPAESGYCHGLGYRKLEIFAREDLEPDDDDYRSNYERVFGIDWEKAES